MTDLLKVEMNRVNAARRAVVVGALHDFAAASGAAARARAEGWQALLPTVTGGDAAVATAAKEYVSAIARKAEAKARAVSQAAKARAGGAGGGSVLAAGDGAAGGGGAAGAGGGGGGMMFGEDDGSTMAMPANAADL